MQAGPLHYVGCYSCRNDGGHSDIFTGKAFQCPGVTFMVASCLCCKYNVSTKWWNSENVCSSFEGACYFLI